MSETVSPAYECRHCMTPLRSQLRQPVRSQWRAVEGQPFPLGVSWLPMDQACNFAVYSMHAQSVELLLFRENELETPACVFLFDPLRNKSGMVWHYRVPISATNDAKFYAYRMRGSGTEPLSTRHAFDSEKLLLDPYARSVYFPAAFDRAAAQRPGSNIGKAPLGLLVECQCKFEWNGDSRIRHESDLIIYEMHVRGFTRHQSSGLPVLPRQNPTARWNNVMQPAKALPMIELKANESAGNQAMKIGVMGSAGEQILLDCGQFEGYETASITKLGQAAFRTITSQRHCAQPRTH